MNASHQHNLPIDTGLIHEKALVVFSGGQDSTTCLFWAKKHFKEVYALSFVYGQKHSPTPVSLWIK